MADHHARHNPLGQRAGYETAWRVLLVLRLTGWISQVGEQRDPLTGHVLSELYQVHERALDFQQACAIDASLPALQQSPSVMRTTWWIGLPCTSRQRLRKHPRLTLPLCLDLCPLRPSPLAR